MNTHSAEPESGQILSVLANVLTRRKSILLVCLLGMLAFVFYYNTTALPVYQSGATVLFEEVRDNPVPTDVSNNLSWEVYLFNRIEEINSRAFAQDVAIALPKEALARFPAPKEATPDFDRMRYITDLLDDGISAHPLRNSNIVSIGVRLNDARLCVVVANLSLKVLDERSGQIRDKGIANLRVFVEDQLTRSAAQLATSEADLSRFKEARGISSLEDDSREMLKRLTEAEILYNATLAEVGAVNQRLTAVRQDIASQRSELVPTVTSIAGSSAQILRDKLVGLEAQQAQLSLQKYPDDHPQAVRLRQEIEQTKKALADEAMKLAKASVIGDPLPRIERRLEEAVSLQIEVEGLEARAKALEQPVSRYRTWLDNLPEKELGLTRLERNRDANQKIYMSLLQRQEDIRIAAAKQVPSSRVIDRPLLPTEPIQPRKMLNLGMGGVLGLIIGFGLGFVIESGTGRLGSLLEFEQMTGWSVLARIPKVAVRRAGWRWLRASSRRRRGAPARHENTLVALRDPESVAGESYNMLRTRLELLGMGSKFRSLLVTSCAPGDGKSSTLSNLAVAFGTFGRSTVVVDAEFRRPTIHSIFGVAKSPGLAELLLARNGVGSSARVGENATASPPANGWGFVIPNNYSHLQETEIRRVAVLASGSQTQESSRKVSWDTMRDVLEDLKKKYEIVLVDSPPPALVHETLILCGMVDAVIVVVDMRSLNTQRLMEARLLLDRVGANVIGAVLNKTQFPGRYAYSYRRERTPRAPKRRRRLRSSQPLA